MNKLLGSMKKDKSKRDSIILGDSSESKHDSTSESNSVTSRTNYQDDMYSDIDYQTKDNFQNHDPLHILKTTNKSKNIFTCKMCGNNDPPFVILNCNHIYHINCLAKEQVQSAIQCPILDNDTFFNTIKCNCGEVLEYYEIRRIQDQFYQGTYNYIKTHDLKINKLETQINILKEEMKICM